MWKGQEGILPAECLEGPQPLISGIWPPGPGQNKVVLFSVTTLVVAYYSSLWKRIQEPCRPCVHVLHLPEELTEARERGVTEGAHPLGQQGKAWDPASPPLVHPLKHTISVVLLFFRHPQ